MAPSDSTKPADAAKAAVNNQPVTVKIAVHSGIVNDNDLKRFFIDPVKQKYPHITIERINVADKGMSLNELVAAGSIPDMVINYPYNLTDLTKLGIDYNMDELIKKNGIDLNRISPEYLESIKTVTGFNYYTGLPMTNNTFALFYNKDIFDRFGVPYPKDGMTWDDAREIAVKLTRNDKGTQYYGLFPDNVYRGAYQASLPFVDLKNNKSVFQTDEWKNLFQLWYSLYKMPGADIMPKEMNTVNGFKTGQIAMFSGYSGQIPDLLAMKDLKWDIVTYPTNKVAPGVGQRVDSPMMSVTNASKVKDAAMQVISVLLSDEIQTEMTKNLQSSVLKDPKINAQFGKATPELSSKNVAAFTKLKVAVLKPFGFVPVGSAAGIPINAFTEMLYNNKDVNTALREADEKMTQVINEELQKLKK
ncbi:extracellular solute-binding protein [Paenibacillus ginsengarvi]|uniref:extracellular solute-binding protein n=1 Tax=Paenibacillus ginsengarvi TaxID=400777 RepID=UPI0013153CEE|nr:extracellular solute-binding protein [Paenibacillus ginsengarvi]